MQHIPHSLKRRSGLSVYKHLNGETVPLFPAGGRDARVARDQGDGRAGQLHVRRDAQPLRPELLLRLGLHIGAKNSRAPRSLCPYAQSQRCRFARASCLRFLHGRGPGGVLCGNVLLWRRWPFFKQSAGQTSPARALPAPPHTAPKPHRACASTTTSYPPHRARTAPSVHKSQSPPRPPQSNLTSSDTPPDIPRYAPTPPSGGDPEALHPAPQRVDLPPGRPAGAQAHVLRVQGQRCRRAQLHSPALRVLL